MSPANWAGCFAITAKTGKQLWWSPDILHFVAAGRQRVYASDKLGRLRILDAGTGSMLDMLPTGGLPIKVCNNQTDRIYLATDGGLVQCLHEVDETKPIVYVEANKPQAEEEPLPTRLVGKTQPKSGEGGAAKPATKPKPPAKKPAAKKDDSGFGDDPFPAADADKPVPDKPAKPREVRRHVERKARPTLPRTTLRRAISPTRQVGPAASIDFAGYSAAHGRVLSRRL